MAVRPVVITGDPVLHRPAAKVARFDEDLRALVADMYETMDAAHGVGLAAPQIGVGLRIFTYTFQNDDDVAPRGVLVNPVLTPGKISQEAPDPDEESEGCLSVPGLGFDTPRRQRARVSGLDEHGQEHEAEATGLLARCFQHEHDHLQGTLYVNRLEGEARREAWRRIRAEDYARTVAEVRQERAGTLGSSFGG